MLSYISIQYNGTVIDCLIRCFVGLEVLPEEELYPLYPWRLQNSQLKGMIFMYETQQWSFQDIRSA